MQLLTNYEKSISKNNLNDVIEYGKSYCNNSPSSPLVSWLAGAFSLSVGGGALVPCCNNK